MISRQGEIRLPPRWIAERPREDAAGKTASGHGRCTTVAGMAVAAEITAATLAPLSDDERRLVVKLLRKLG